MAAYYKVKAPGLRPFFVETIREDDAHLFGWETNHAGERGERMHYVEKPVAMTAYKMNLKYAELEPA